MTETRGENPNPLARTEKRAGRIKADVGDRVAGLLSPNGRTRDDPRIWAWR
jgi:hypothetical protein